MPLKRSLLVVTVLTVPPLHLITHYRTADRPCRTADRGALTAPGYRPNTRTTRTS